MSSARCRALRRSFWGSPVLWSLGRFLDALRGLPWLLIAALPVLVLTVVVLLSVIRSCPTEDSTYCLWDSTQHGNGQGNSILNLWEGFTLPLPK